MNFDRDTLDAVLEALVRGDHAKVHAIKRDLQKSRLNATVACAPSFRPPHLVCTSGKSDGKPRGRLHLVQ
jgi:hypothetical protein